MRDTSFNSGVHISAIPFLKWAGGKRWLSGYLDELVPTQFNRYIEPFVGGGAIFFMLQPKNALLSDANARLIECYEAIRSNWAGVETELRRHHRSHSKSYYYEERKKRRRTPYKKAAQFIYLNRTCWNGLYRVNLRGDFNVPIGTKSQVVMETDNFEHLAKLLSRASIKCCDFSESVKKAKAGDFLFVDPPYTVKHNMNGFVKYNEKIFTWDDQVRLHENLKEASDRGVLISVTNANHESIRDLYSDFPLAKSLERYSVLSGVSTARTLTSELLIRNW